LSNARIAKWVVAAMVLAATALGTGPAGAAVSTIKPAKAKTQTWIGQVQRQGAHFDYVGQPCPVGAGMMCANYVARYRIVPQSPAVTKALRHVAGSQARIQARFSPAHDRTHQGTLLATAVGPWCPPGAMCVPPPGHTITVDEAANGSAVTLAAGDHLQVVLHSTYWQFNAVSDPAVLTADGAAQPGPGTNCPTFPGSGCGTRTQTYSAAEAGTAVVSASRTSCGEARACSPAESSYKLTVHVH